jgi:hypothetical protein
LVFTKKPPVMKKILLPIIAFVCILSVGCKKSDTNTPAPTIPSNGWTLGSTTYTTFYGFRVVDGSDGSMFLSVVDRNPVDPAVNSALVAFKTVPAAGTYKVVAWTGVSSTLGANECSVSAGYDQSSGSTHIYNSTGTGTVYVTVSISGGKFTMVVPEIPVANQSTPSDVTTFKGTLKES